MNESVTTKNLPEESRPYEKCLANGTEALSDAELLAVILRCGSDSCNSVQLASEVLSVCRASGGLGGLYHLSIPQLMEIRGIGKVKAIQLKCIGEISRRIARGAARSSLRLNDPETIARYYMETLRHEEQETVMCVMADTRNHFLGDTVISRGTVNGSLVSPREVFLQALAFHAVGIILIHNHPSGDPTPSRDDAVLTERIRKAGEILGIQLLDHIIIGDRTYCSLAEGTDGF